MVEDRRRERQPVAEQLLVDAGVEAEAVLGREVRSAVDAEALVERRRLGARSGAGAQLRSGLVDVIGGGGAPGVEGLAVLDRVDAAAERQVEAVEQLEPMLGEDGIGDLPRADRRERAVVRIGVLRSCRGLGLVARAEDEIAEAAELQVALVFRAVAVAEIAGAAVEDAER